MGRAPCCEKVGLKKGRWTTEEDELLIKYIQANGEGSWRSLPKNAGLLRCGKSCRLRWLNYLRADVKRGNITPQEEELIIRLHTSLGNRWSLIAGHLPGRTDNEIKNYWNSRLSRKIQSFTRPGNESHPTNFMNMPKFTPATCKRRRGRIGRSGMMKKNKHRFMPPKAATTIGQVEPSKHMDEFDEILGQFDEQSVVSWPSEESSSAIKLCPSNNNNNNKGGPHEGLGGESEIMCLDDILGSGAVDPSGVLSHNDERENGGSGTTEERENGPDQVTTSTSEGRSREQQQSGGVWSSKTESGEMYTGSSAMSNNNWVDWNMESNNVHDQKLLDEEEMLSWLWDGGNGEGHHI